MCGVSVQTTSGRPELPAEIADAVDGSVEIERVYAAGRIPPDDRMDAETEYAETIAAYVNGECGLHIDSREL